MFQGHRIAVVIPSFNEAERVGDTIRSVPPFVDRVVVVDDGSSDATALAARMTPDPRTEVISHGQNLGAGAAIVTGYRAAAEAGADIVAVMAGDGQMDPRDLPSLLEAITRGDADYAKGNRLSHPECRERMPRVRWLGNQVLSTLTRWATGLRVHDSQCGYTALRRGFLESLIEAPTWPRYGYPNDFLGRLGELGAQIRDVIVRPVYGTEASGIGWRHALFVVPYILGRVALRRLRLRRLRLAAEELAPRLDL